MQQAPVAGEVPFFLGINHLKAMKAKEDVPDIQLLVLSKEQSLELFAEYPEDYTTICTNLMLEFDLTIEGCPIPGNDVDITDKDKMETTARIVESMNLRLEQRFLSLCQAARSGDADTVVTLARQGANLNQVFQRERGSLREIASARTREK